MGIAEKRLENSNNREFWITKIEQNIKRDEEINKQLKFLGWTVLRFWGTDIKKNLDDCVRTVEEAIWEVKFCQTDEE